MADLNADGDGADVTVMRLAVGRPRRPGNHASEADFVDVVVRGAHAKAVARYLGKGNRVGVTGRLHQHTWRTPEGRRSKVQVVANPRQLNFIDFKDRGDQPAEPVAAPTAGPAADGDATAQQPAARPDGQATEVVIAADGGCRGNPGPAGYGVVITTPSTPVAGEDRVREAQVLAELSEGIGWGTNNVAEYRAVIAGLDRARILGARTAHVRSDSRLVVNQLTGAAQVRNAALQPLHDRVMELVGAFERVTFERVAREANARADALANQAMDAQGPLSDPAKQAAEAGSAAR